MQEERFLKGSDILIVKKSQNVFFYSCNSTLLRGLFFPLLFVAYFVLCKNIWQALLEEIWQPKICQRQASLLERAWFWKFEYIRQARVVKKENAQRWNRERVSGCSVGDGLRNIRGREEQDTLTAMCQLIFSPINHKHELAWVSQSLRHQDKDCLQIFYSLLSCCYCSPLFQLTLSFEHVLWVTHLTATATGCEEGELSRGAM